MRGIPLLAVFLVSAAGLAGCSGADRDLKPYVPPADPATSGTATDDPTAGSTTSPPTAPAAARIAVELRRENPNGPIPLLANLTLNATFLDGQGRAANATGVSWTATLQQVANATGAAVAGGVVGIAAGTALPFPLHVNLTMAGTYRILATVRATGFPEGSASVEVSAIPLPPPGEKVTVFFDGAEGDGSQWAIASRVLVDQAETPASHADNWTASADEHRTGKMAWFSAYPDNYRSSMTSVPFVVPAGGAGLSYWIKGGAEDNGFDGLHVLVGDDPSRLTEVAHHAGRVDAWTGFTVPLPGGYNVIRFRFDSDSRCSSESGDPTRDRLLCGEGHDAGGFHLDDIRVA